MQLKHGRKLVGIGGALALTCALIGTSLPALADTPDTPQAGGLAVNPYLSVAPSYSAPTTDAPIYRAASIPASVDLTTFAPPVGDQGANGACVSWGTGYTTMGWWARKAGDTTKLFSPMYLYSQAHVSSTSDGGGSYPSTNYNILQSQGITTSSEWGGDNYDFSRTPNATETAAAAEFKTGAYHQLFYSGSAQSGVGTGAETAIKQALANGYPVGIGIPIYDSFYYLNSNDYTYMLSDPGSTTNYEGGHYVVALGYDATGVIIENSWGAYWGNAGFAKIGWDFIDAKAVEAEYMEGPLTYTTAQRAPGAITNFTSPTQDASSIDLTWTAPASSGSTPISSYTLTTSGGGTSSTIMVAGAATSAHVGNLNPSTNYTFTLTASNTLNLVSPSVSTSSATQAAPVVVPTVQPSAPVAIPTTTPSTSTTTPSVDSTVSNTVAPVQSLIPNEPVVSNVVSNTTSTVSNGETFTPTPKPTSSTPVVSNPTTSKPVAKPVAKAPTLGKMAMRITRTTAKLTWTAAKANSGTITKYQLVVKYRGKVIQSHTYKSNVRTTTLSKLQHAKNYTLVVYAYNSAGKATSVNRNLEMG